MVLLWQSTRCAVRLINGGSVDCRRNASLAAFLFLYRFSLCHCSHRASKRLPVLSTHRCPASLHKSHRPKKSSLPFFQTAPPPPSPAPLAGYSPITAAFPFLATHQKPKVNGQLSQTCYLRALDSCYDRLAAKKTKQRAAGDGGKEGGEGEAGRRPFVLSDVEHVLCHSPYNKLVQKSLARMAFSDARRLRAEGEPLGGEGQEEALGKWLDVPAEVCVCVCVTRCVLGASVSCVKSPRCTCCFCCARLVGVIVVGIGFANQHGGEYTSISWRGGYESFSCPGRALVCGTCSRGKSLPVGPSAGTPRRVGSVLHRDSERERELATYDAVIWNGGLESPRCRLFDPGRSLERLCS